MLSRVPRLDREFLAPPWPTIEPVPAPKLRRTAERERGWEGDRPRVEFRGCGLR